MAKGKVSTAKAPSSKGRSSSSGRSRSTGSGGIRHNEEVLNEVKEAMDQVLADISAEFLARVKELTPVDTGYAQSRWVLDDVTETGFTISNDADYIEYLENGSSNQAPNGMLGIATAEIPSMVDRACARHKVEDK